jgi:hypothetical protein
VSQASGGPVYATADFSSISASSYRILSESGDFLITEDNNNIVTEDAP